MKLWNIDVPPEKEELAKLLLRAHQIVREEPERFDALNRIDVELIAPLVGLTFRNI
jgi:hypothetical protein